MSAIRLKIKKNPGDYDPGVSKFLGNPTLPKGWANTFDESVIFFLQINLEELAELDKENVLPHKGYLYFFLDIAESQWDMKAIVRYYPGIPEEIVDGFNEAVPGFEKYTKDFVVEFEETDEASATTRLLGIPNDWNYAEEHRKLLLQFDPLDSDLDGLFTGIDGLLYFFFDEKEPFKYEKVKVELVEEFS